MPAVVVDLISSSPSPESPLTEIPRTRGPSGRHTARPTNVERNREALENRRTGLGKNYVADISLSGLTDEFDTAVEADDPIVPLPRKPTGGTSSTANFNTNTVGHAGYGNASSTVEVEFLSDDFDTTGDLNEPILVESTGNKRRRVSPSPGNDKSCVRPPSNDALTNTLRCGGAGNRSSAALGGHSNTLHTQHGATQRSAGLPSSSDPFASSPPRNLACSPPLAVAADRGASPDPTATSPKGDSGGWSGKHGGGTENVSGPLQHQFSDPFASSPRLESKGKEKAAGRRKASLDIEVISSPVAQRGPSQSRSRQEWDPISSSAPEGAGLPADNTISGNGSCHSTAINIGSDSLDDSEDELPDIAKLARQPPKPRARLPMQRLRSDVLPSNSTARTAKSSTKSAQERTRNREAKAAAKEAEKGKKRQEKQEAKEARAREKERAAALAEVNKMRTDKKVSTPEMIVDLPASLSATTKAQVETLLEGLQVQHTTWESTVENVVKWRRKVTSRFNEDMGHFEPIPPRIMAENHVAVIVTADEFVNLALNERLDAHVAGMEEKFPGHQITYLVEGLMPWMRKNRNIRNRQFTSVVRSQEASSSSAGRRRNGLASEYVPEDIIEDALLQLQVMHEVFIHHTTIPLETAQWLVVLTQHISTIPYKKQRDQATLGAGFCMEAGQVRTGDDAKDTYIRMLQEIARVTAPIAYGVAAEFGSVSELVKGLDSGGSTTLEGVRKSVNKDGAVSDRTVGQAVSKRMHKVFTGRDETSTDV